MRRGSEEGALLLPRLQLRARQAAHSRAGWRGQPFGRFRGSGRFGGSGTVALS